MNYRDYVHCHEGLDTEICVNCGEPVENGSSFCSDECDIDYRSND